MSVFSVHWTHHLYMKIEYCDSVRDPDSDWYPSRGIREKTRIRGHVFAQTLGWRDFCWTYSRHWRPRIVNSGLNISDCCFPLHLSCTSGQEHSWRWVLKKMSHLHPRRFFCSCCDRIFESNGFHPIPIPIRRKSTVTRQSLGLPDTPAVGDEIF